MPDYTGAAAHIRSHDHLLSICRDSRARRVADNRALAGRLRQAKADSEAAASRASALCNYTRLLVEETRRLLAD